MWKISSIFSLSGKFNSHPLWRKLILIFCKPINKQSFNLQLNSFFTTTNQRKDLSVNLMLHSFFTNPEKLDPFYWRHNLTPNLFTFFPTEDQRLRFGGAHPHPCCSWLGCKLMQKKTKQNTLSANRKNRILRSPNPIATRNSVHQSYLLSKEIK